MPYRESHVVFRSPIDDLIFHLLGHFVREKVRGLQRHNALVPEGQIADSIGCLQRRVTAEFPEHLSDLPLSFGALLKSP